MDSGWGRGGGDVSPKAGRARGRPQCDTHTAGALGSRLDWSQPRQEFRSKSRRLFSEERLLLRVWEPRPTRLLMEAASTPAGGPDRLTDRPIQCWGLGVARNFMPGPIDFRVMSISIFDYCLRNTEARHTALV